ncbi:MAG: helix-turn-helix domain-containing protein, partial [Ktedonobacteraceae bacterium]
MRKTFHYRLYPGKKQLNTLETMLEECRWLYNETLAFRKNAWEQRQERVSWYDSKARIPLLKIERPSLKQVHSQVLQNVTERVELAYQAFFRRCKAGENPGYP